MKKLKNMSFAKKCFVVCGLSLCILIAIGIIIGTSFVCKNIESRDWLSFIGSFVASILGLTGTIVLGFIAVEQNNRAKQVNDRLQELEEKRFKQENTCMIEFDSGADYHYRGYVKNFLEDCKKMPTNALVVSEIHEEKLFEQFDALKNDERIYCATFDFYFKETMAPIREVIIKEVECNRLQKDNPNSIKQSTYKRFNVMSWYAKGVLCSYIPGKKLRQLPFVFFVEDKNFWNRINDSSNVLFDIKLDLVSYAGEKTSLDITIDLGQLGHSCPNSNGTLAKEKINMLEYNSDTTPNNDTENNRILGNKLFEIERIDEILINKEELS